jgi:hypothetical protein
VAGHVAGVWQRRADRTFLEWPFGRCEQEEPGRKEQDGRKGSPQARETRRRKFSLEAPEGPNRFFPNPADLGRRSQGRWDFDTCQFRKCGADRSLGSKGTPPPPRNLKLEKVRIPKAEVRSYSGTAGASRTDPTMFSTASHRRPPSSLFLERRDRLSGGGRQLSWSRRPH